MKNIILNFNLDANESLEFNGTYIGCEEDKYSQFTVVKRFVGKFACPVESDDSEKDSEKNKK